MDARATYGRAGIHQLVAARSAVVPKEAARASNNGLPFRGRNQAAALAGVVLLFGAAPPDTHTRSAVMIESELPVPDVAKP